MAVIRIKNSTTAGSFPSGLTKGELAVNLSDRSLYVGGTVGNSIFISGVQSFNGKTGAVQGASLVANTFTGLNQFRAGISAAGATLGTLIVHNGISASGLVRAVSGISASGVTLGRLFANRGATCIFEGDITVGQYVRIGMGNRELTFQGNNGCILIGEGALENNVPEGSILNPITGWDNIAIGVCAQINNTEGEKNVALGSRALFSNVLGVENTAIGYESLKNALGNSNVAIGAFSGFFSANPTAITSSVFIGNYSSSVSNGENQIVIGYGSGSDGSNTTVIGSSSTTSTRVYGLFSTNGGVSAAGATFGSLVRALGGISAAGATLGTLTVHNGISANGGATFSGLVHAVSGISAAGATLGTLIVHNGISASGGVTFHNTVYVGGGASFGNSIDVASDISFGGDLKKSGQAVNLITVYGKTADLPRPGLEGEVAFVNGLSAGVSGAGYGLYLWDGGFSFEYDGVRGSWIRITDSEGYRFNQDLNGDGIIDGTDLSFLLAAWGSSGAEYSQGGSQTLLMGIGDGLENAFEVKVFGISTGKKASAFKITSDEAEPYVYFQANETNFDSRVIISDSSGEPALHVQTGRSLFSEGVEFQAGFSAGCVGGGITFNCLTHFTQGLSASGATLGTLVVNGGSTFNGPVHMGATLTMNSNIRFNTGYGISGGFIDAGWY